MIKDLFLNDKEAFEESFFYGRHYIVLDKGDTFLALGRLRKKKNRLFLDIQNTVYLPLVGQITNSCYPLGSWIFGTPTNKESVGGKKAWQWEFVCSVIPKEEIEGAKTPCKKICKKKFKNGMKIDSEGMGWK